MGEPVSAKIRKFEEFWPFYVGEHRDPRTRRLHFVGTGLSFVFLFLAAFKSQPVWLLAAVISGYTFAWFSHFFIERNQPATFRHPFYSLLADYRMFSLMLNGRMQAEADRILGAGAKKDP